MNRQKIFYGLVVLVVVFNLSVFVVASGYVDDFARSKVQLTTQDLRNNINERIASYTNILQAASWLFSGQPQLDQNQWSKFTQKTDVLSKYPGTDAFAYAPIIPTENLSLYLGNLRNLKGGEFNVYPNPSGKLIAPILYIESDNPNAQKEVGFNMLSEPNRKAAIEYVVDNNSIAVTNKVGSLSDTSSGSQGSNFIIYYPIYKNDTPIDTAEQRRENIQGVVAAVIHSERFMQGLNLNMVPGIKFQLFDGSTNGELSVQSLLFNSGTPAMSQTGYVSRYGSIDTLPWPNTNWSIRYVAERDLPLLRLIKTAQYLVAASVFAFSGLLLVLVYFVFRRSYKLRYLDTEYRAKIAAEDAIIDEIPDSIIVTDERGVVRVYNSNARKLLRYPAIDVVNKKTIIKLLVPGSFSNFDELITPSLVHGADTKKLQFIVGDGKHISVPVVIHPVYDRTQDLVGYEFMF